VLRRPQRREPRVFVSTGTSPAVDSQRSRFDASRSLSKPHVIASNLASTRRRFAPTSTRSSWPPRARPPTDGVDYVTVLIAATTCVRRRRRHDQPRRLPNRVHQAFRPSGAPPRTHGCSWSASRTRRAVAGRTRRASRPCRLGHLPDLPNVLASTTTDADRQVVAAREVEFNATLAKECTRLRRCRWTATPSTGHVHPRNVSPVDHYHPSVAGQHLLAELHRGGYWPH